MTLENVIQTTGEHREWVESLVDRREHLACKSINSCDDWWDSIRYTVYIIPGKVLDVYYDNPHRDYVEFEVAFSEPEYEGCGYHHLVCANVERKKRAFVNTTADSFDRAIDGLTERGYELRETKEDYGKFNDEFVVMEVDHRDGYEYDMEKLEL